MAGKQLEKPEAQSTVTAVDLVDEPSAEWGWHGEFPKATRIGGWVVAAILLLMLIGNHQGRVEDLWLIGLAALLVFILVRDAMRRRTSWRR
ncbi:DUF2631 domain-containing protein [Rhodococcus sp. X156]|uniref:DUF2631 domain-containing protein n=1 Tax=Rhodococcus sp. X156 TaxID=2499145 RepID=UPI000FD98498|nr:DUF2631 domain-containing protein [Rhodococcus sp. X156]